MSWLQLKLDTTRDGVEAVEDALLAAGAVSVTLLDRADQPILEPAVGETPLWDQVRVIGLFTANTDTEQATETARDSLGKELPDHSWEILEDKDWEREWMKYYHPIQCGERLWICPSWLEPPVPNAVNLMLDPGLAFGTGTHPTTFLCLQWLDGIDLKGKTVVDYGCGSGILGIAALLLGAEKVIAIDNDPQALLATRDNGERNNIDPNKLFTYLPGEQPELQADVTVANILAAPLISLAETISGLTRSGGKLCMAGLIVPQIEDVMAPYANQFEFDTPVSKEDWARLSGVKTQ
ncbi:50S ribosomal protein L11 methyltransferase [Porticoccaceae bacterium LTM1]|nr:50S ribosomal protein L11 methyltransferase [Porticoccaceae bacterium LTM1]